MKKYFTTTLPYPNDELHLGHVLENVCMDARVRFEKLRGFDVIYNTGSDEHGTKIKKAAQDAGMSPQQFVDNMSKTFEKTLKDISICPDIFTRTTDEKHKKGARAFWKKCAENGWIYKKKHSGMYCVGCEFFVTEKDLTEDGLCPYHPNKKPDFVEEENYFFKLSAATDALKEHHTNNATAIIPETRRNEALAFLDRGLEDISISRDKSRLDWGIPVPDDDEQVMYVWFDALTNYITTIGWPDDNEWNEWWPVIQSAGKDNMKHQCIIWQAMLHAAGLPFSKQVYIHGFINDKEGRKMSKTLGNGITPAELIDEYGYDGLRFLMVAYTNPFEDTQFSREGAAGVYNDDLVNGVGNATARVLTLSHKYIPPIEDIPPVQFSDEYIQAFEAFDFRSVAECIRAEIRKIDMFVTEKKPFETIKTDPEQAKKDISACRDMLVELAYMLLPVIPNTAETMFDSIRKNTPPPPLFPRK